VTSLCTSVFTQGTVTDRTVAHEQVPLWPLRRAILNGGFRRISIVRRRKKLGLLPSSVFGPQSHSPCPTGLQTGVNEMKTDGVGSGFGSQSEDKIFWLKFILLFRTNGHSCLYNAFTHFTLFRSGHPL